MTSPKAEYPPLAPPPTRGNSAPPPAIVRRSVLVLWAVAAVATVRTIYVVLAHDQLIGAYAKTQPAGLPRDLVALQAPAYTETTLVDGLALGVVVALAALYVLRGNNGARRIAVAACGLSLPPGLYTLLQPATATYRILGVLTAILALAAMVMLYQKPAIEHFNR